MIAIKEIVFSANIIDGEKKIEFRDGLNLIYSAKNSLGKTTLIRIILWAMGFLVPASAGVEFEYLNFALTMQNYEDEEIIIKIDKDKKIILVKNGMETPLSDDNWRDVVRKIIFGIDDNVMQDNLLGAFYIDQEQGWNVANRGKVIGINVFSIDDVLLALSQKSAKDIDKQISILDEEVKGYNGLLSMAQSAVEMGRFENEEDEENAISLIRTRLYELRIRKKYCVERLSALDSALKDSAFIKELINGYHFTVIADDGSRIHLTSDRIEGFADREIFIETRRSILCKELSKYNDEENQLKRELERLEDKEHKESYLSYCMAKIKSIDIRQETIRDIVTNLKLKRRAFCEEKKKMMSADIMQLMSTVMCKYLEELLPRNTYEAVRNQILTHTFAPFSGAERSKRVVAFKLTYISIIHKFYNVKLPIIIDSPFAKEMDEDNYERIMKVLRRDFSDHQIIIASIHEKLEKPYHKIDLSNGLLEGNATYNEIGCD